MGLTKPVFTRQEAEALTDALQYVLSEPDTATRALGTNPERIQDAMRALDKLQQHTRRNTRAKDLITH